ncbi:hypothetical protein [Rhodopirellula baltica]|uniref:Uncharacterized protein n=1 Tax=Rhodopirellula baltica SWK14 TaxID=993516 RepID=L7CNZ0_RHOBT|nr:hypothetical protein [Rhodopirellula baltica]ELP34786.1 hypothetical protein RBSWK_01293 [Rhodopirellula baltica SWK14]
MPKLNWMGPAMLSLSARNAQLPMLDRARLPRALNLAISVNCFPVLLIAFSLMLSCVSTTAQEFRLANRLGDKTAKAKTPDFTLTTKIYFAGERKPNTVHKNIFAEGVIYSVSESDPRFLTVFDLNQSMIVLLDQQTKTRCSVSMDELTRLTARADASVTDPMRRERLGMNARVRLIGPQQYEMTYPGVRYEVEGVAPPSPAMAIANAQLVDWACRLNIARPRGLPPFGRMRLNDELWKQSLIGVKTKLSIDRNGADGEPVMKANLNIESDWSEGLDDDAERQIDQVRGYRVVYKQVNWSEFAD